MNSRVTVGLLLAAVLAVPGTLFAEPAPAGSVVATVKSPSGELVAGVRVSALAAPHGRAEFSDANRLATGVTDAQGVVRLGGIDPSLSPVLTATPPDSRWKEFADHVTPAWKVADTTITLEVANVMRGTVRDPQRRPVPYAYVHAQLGQWESGTYADKEGAFEFLNAPKGRATLYAEIEEKGGQSVFSGRPQFDTNATGVVLTLQSSPRKPKAQMTIRVFTPGGRPVMYGRTTFSGRKTVVHARGGRTMHSSSSGGWLRGGAARTDDFDMALKLEVVGARSELGEWLGCGPGRGGPYGPGPREGKLVLPVGLELRGRVFGPDERPISGIRVSALTEAKAPPPGFSVSAPDLAQLMGSAHGEGVSGTDGSFLIVGLEQRNYRLQPRPTKAYVGGHGVQAQAGTADAEIHMHRAVSPFVTLKDEKGQPVANAVVRVKPVRASPFFVSSDGQLEVQTGRDGKARLVGLDPREHHDLTVFPPTARSDLLAREILKWLPENIVLTLERAKAIAGVVTDQDGEPVGKARLTWQHVGDVTTAAAKKQKATTRPDGSFSLENLRPGKYRVWVKAPKGVLAEASKRNPALIPSGSKGVSLKLLMPDTLKLRLRAYTKKLGKPDILLVAEGKGGKGPSSVSKKVDKEGSVVFDGLRWDVKYTVWMGGLRDSKLVFEGGLQPQDRKLELKLLNGQTVTGTILCPKGTSKKKVRAVFPGFEIKGKIKGGTHFEIANLPPAPWTIRITGMKGKTEYQGEAVAKTTEGVEVRLEPK